MGTISYQAVGSFENRKGVFSAQLCGHAVAAKECLDAVAEVLKGAIVLDKQLRADGHLPADDFEEFDRISHTFPNVITDEKEEGGGKYLPDRTMTDKELRVEAMGLVKAERGLLIAMEEDRDRWRELAVELGMELERRVTQARISAHADVLLAKCKAAKGD